MRQRGGHLSSPVAPVQERALEKLAERSLERVTRPHCMLGSVEQVGVAAQRDVGATVPELAGDVHDVRALRDQQ